MTNKPVLAARSSTMVYWEKLYDFHSDQKEEVQGTFFLTDLSLYSSDSCSEIAGSYKDAR